MPPKLVVAAYTVVVALYLARFRTAILRTDYLILVLAFGFFGLSIFFDAIQDTIAVPGHHYFEDGCKLMGIVGWAAYLVKTAMQQLLLPVPEPLSSRLHHL